MKKFETLTEIYEDKYLNRYSEAIEDDFNPNVEQGTSSNISDEAIKKFIDKEKRKTLTKKEEAALAKYRREKYWKDQGITLMKGKGIPNKADVSLPTSGGDDDSIPWYEDPDFDSGQTYNFPKNFAKIPFMDWKFKGPMGMLSYKLYDSIRNGTVYPKVPKYTITREESDDYLTLPTAQLKYVIDLALENALEIDDSIWDLLEVKSKFQSGKMHKSVGKDREDYYGESFVSLSETYNSMYQNMLEGLDLELYNSILLGVTLNPDMQVQYDVLEELSNGNNSVAMKLIKHYGALWRNIINMFKESNIKLSSENLMKYTTSKTGNDIRKVAKAFRTEVEQSDPQFNN